jgi:hypothetical protein
MLGCESALVSLCTTGDNLTYILGRKEESLPVERLIICLVQVRVQLFLLGLLDHARHFNVIFAFSEPHEGGWRAAGLRWWR